MDYKTKATPPGFQIKEQLYKKSISIDEFATKMHITKDKVQELLDGKCELTYMLAIQLEEVLGVPARYWINQEMLYRERIKYVHDNQI